MATARLQGWRERERERRWFKLNVLAVDMETYFLIRLWYESDDCMTRHAASGLQQDVRW